ncbi:MAG: hypothetical protein LBH37_01705 [Oscillospiraceae bacterium]|jgi:chromosome segregation ATPase|nr:hypothetical protein [Oscillospiraceae bacterium]
MVNNKNKASNNLSKFIKGGSIIACLSAAAALYSFSPEAFTSDPANASAMLTRRYSSQKENSLTDFNFNAFTFSQDNSISLDSENISLVIAQEGEELNKFEELAKSAAAKLEKLQKENNQLRTELAAQKGIVDELQGKLRKQTKDAKKKQETIEKANSDKAALERILADIDKQIGIDPEESNKMPNCKENKIQERLEKILQQKEKLAFVSLQLSEKEEEGIKAQSFIVKLGDELEEQKNKNKTLLQEKESELASLVKEHKNILQGKENKIMEYKKEISKLNKNIVGYEERLSRYKRQSKTLLKQLGQANKLLTALTVNIENCTQPPQDPAHVSLNLYGEED